MWYNDYVDNQPFITLEVREAFRRLVLQGRTVRYIRQLLGLKGEDADYIPLMRDILRGVKDG